MASIHSIKVHVQVDYHKIFVGKNSWQVQQGKQCTTISAQKERDETLGNSMIISQPTHKLNWLHMMMMMMLTCSLAKSLSVSLSLSLFHRVELTTARAEKEKCFLRWNMYTSFLSWCATGSVVVKLADDMEGGHEADEADAHHKHDGGRDLESGRIVRVETQHVAIVSSAEPSSSSSAPWWRCPPPPQTRRSRPLGRRPGRVRSRHGSPAARPARPRRRRRRLALRSLRHRCKLPQQSHTNARHQPKSSRNKTLVRDLANFPCWCWCWCCFPPSREE